MQLRNHYVPATAVVAICTAQSTLPFPPVVCGLVPAGWESVAAGVMPEFDLDVWCDTDGVTLSNAELYGAKLHAFTLADDAITSFDGAANTATKVSHPFRTGDGPFTLPNAGGAAPAELAAASAATGVYLIRVDANTYKFATSRSDALLGNAIDFTGNGTGVTSVHALATTFRVHWHSYGALNPAMSLGKQRAFGVRCTHRPMTIAYALSGTPSAGNISAAFTPVEA
jgi:hypothetical protein